MRNPIFTEDTTQKPSFSPKFIQAFSKNYGTFPQRPAAEENAPSTPSVIIPTFGTR